MTLERNGRDYQLIQSTTTLYCVFSVDNSAIATLDAGNSPGIAAVTRDDAGTYLIDIDPALNLKGVLSLTTGMLLASSLTVIGGVMAADNTGASNQITYATFDATGAWVDPSAGQKFMITIVFRGSP